MAHERGQDHDGLLERDDDAGDTIAEMDRDEMERRWGRAEAEAEDALELAGDESVTPYEEQREAMIDAERSAYYDDMGILP